MDKPKGNYIKIDRKMLEWEWYDTTNTKVLFLHCLLRANWKPTKWHGVSLEPGQFVTSLASLAEETQLTVRQVRVSLNHLIMTGEVTSKCQSKFRIITVNNWDRYQGSDKQSDKEVTSKRQDDDKEVTTDKEYKHISKKEYKEKDISKDISKKKVKNIIPPSLEMVREYCRERNNGIDPEYFIAFYDSKGWMVGKNKMKDWQGAVRTWESKRKADKNDTVAGRTREDEEQHNAELDEHIRRIQAGEFDAEDEELRRMFS